MNRAAKHLYDKALTAWRVGALSFATSCLCRPTPGMKMIPRDHPSHADVMSPKPLPYKVLFLCTGNSSRSIFAESLLNQWGAGRFRAFSAGSFPKGGVNPMALDLLKRLSFPTEGLRSKSWDEFSAYDAPPMDFVITVCDQAAEEVCPVWPGRPIAAHWSVADPAAVEGSEVEKIAAFRSAFQALENRVKLFVSLPIDALDNLKLKRRIDAIGDG
jgi:arsenate reductase